jgi:hypothetical protein
LIRQIHHVFHKPSEDDVSVEKTPGEPQNCRSYPIAYLFLRARKFVDPILFCQVREEVPVPQAPPNGFLIKVLAAGGKGFLI